MLRKAFTLAALALLTVSLTQAQDTFRLTLLHTNDTHAAHAPNSAGNGGVARQAAVQNQIRAEGGNVLLVDAGDRFTGTLFHTLYLGADQVQIMNALGYDVMTLGNHEFDNGDDVLLEFLNGINFPAVAANIDFSANPALDEKVSPYAVLEVGGRQIGVIGLTTADTQFIASPGEGITFSSDYAAVTNAAAAELTEQGVNIIILLTHTGVQVDFDMLAALENVDVVVGGHSHTLLSNLFRAPENYPYTVKNAAGQTIYYVQAGANNQYLGRLDLTFDANGVATAASGDVIALSRYITPDETLDNIVAELSVGVEALRNQPIGASTAVDLVGDRTVCRIEECDLGNLIADAMREYAGTQIAIMNGGGIRRDIPAGEITLGTILELQPFGNLVATFEISGTDLLAALEHGVARIALNEQGQVKREGGSGRFPQVSGMRFSFDPTKPEGSRIVSVEIQQPDGSFVALDPEATYSVATNNFIRTGGDGYTMFKDKAINAYDFGRVDYEVTANYLASLGTVQASPVDPNNPRITIVNAEVEPRK
ncbi:MAG: 5'-nucleotidase C-terminal domain-containing protein [Anaerolineae bacterium]|nr:5'-nucleotidase C-terminal domain-containing protein [Anaerolineae bacterium]MDW8173566.1 5'-nucleotidase C-terminal domain-containing protein [Anaerolineae bacterium]